MSRRAFTRQQGTAVLLRKDFVDTDQIVPARFCKRLGKTGYADALFADCADEPGYAELLASPHFGQACFIIAGQGFGIGSSREHAVWALSDSGFVAVIALSFGEIFRVNCLKNGVLPIVLAPDQHQRLSEAVRQDPAIPVSVDLEATSIRIEGLATYEFDIDAQSRWMILNGLDEIDIALRRTPQLPAFEQGRPPWLPVLTATGSNGRLNQETLTRD